MKALVADRFGPPLEVLSIKELPSPQAGAGQVRVRMLLSPINPSDLLMIQGKYGKQPPCPAFPASRG